jgi:hypothetical protein
MGPRAVAHESEVAERRPSIDLLAVGDVGHRPKRAAVDVLCIQPQRSIPTPWNTLRGVQTDEVAPGDVVEDAPHLSFRVGEKGGGGGLAPGSSIKIEAQAEAAHSAGPPIERSHTTPSTKGAVVHVGAIGEVADALPGRPDEWQPMKPV